MNDRLFPAFSDTLEWNLVARATYTAPIQTNNNRSYYLPIVPRSWVISDSHVLLIGVKTSEAKASWYTGGWASQRLLFVPSIVSEYTATAETSTKRLRLGSLTLFIAEKLMPTWLLYVTFPRWFVDASIEVWRYDGQDVDLFQRMAELEAKINAITP